MENKILESINKINFPAFLFEFSVEADYILIEYPFCTNVFISVNTNDRIERVAQRANPLPHPDPSK